MPQTSTTFDLTARIEALTRNARTTWFSLLGVILFVGVTLMGVEHIDFYGVDRATQLPLVNVSVQTTLFFYAAPVLTAAVYIYFHLYLIRLFDELGAAPHRMQGKPLGQAVAPWLVTDAALWVRQISRKDRSAKARPFEGVSALFNILLAWGAGLFVLGFAWERSLPARTFELSALSALSLWAAILLAAASFTALIERMSGRESKRSNLPIIFVGIVSFCILLEFTYRKTMGSAGQLADLDLTGEAIVERPAGWLPYAVAKSEYRDAWCARKREDDCEALSAELEAEFDGDWRARRAATLADMRRPGWSVRGKATPDRSFNLKKALLSDAYLVGVDLAWARMEDANLIGAQLEGANLTNARMLKTKLNLARLENAQLSFARMPDAELNQVELTGADLRGAQMQRVDFIGAGLERTVLAGANLKGANMHLASVFGWEGQTILLNATNLNAVAGNGTALRFVDLTGAAWDARTDLRNSFLDGTVRMPDQFYLRMNRPCQWIEERLSHSEFVSVWHWWLAKLDAYPLWIPNKVRYAAPPDKTRLAELGLTDCEPNQPFGPMPRDQIVVLPDVN